MKGETAMNYAVDYSEKEATGLKWKNGEEPERFTFVPFLAENKKGVFDERAFLETLGAEDTVFLEGIGVNETLAFLASTRGAKVMRVFAMDAKNARTELGLEKKDTHRVLFTLATKRVDIFREYVQINPELHLLRRWVGLHVRFQKRFRTGADATLALLGKEVQKLQAFGHLEASKAAGRVEKQIEAIQETAQRLEKQFLAEVEKSLADILLWQKVLEPITGIGPTIGGKLCSRGPRNRFKNRDHFIAAAGFHVKDGRAARRKAGESLRRDNSLFDAVLQFVRKVDWHDSEWKEKFLKRKAEYLAQGLPKWQADKAARRYVGTKLLRHIWREWTKIEP